MIYCLYQVFFRERAGTGKRERDGYAMKRITMVIAGLGGRGHDISGNYAMEHPDEVEIAAVADPRPERLELAQRAVSYTHLPASRHWGIWNVFCIGKAARLCGIHRMCCWPGTRTVSYTHLPERLAQWHKIAVEVAGEW